MWTTIGLKNAENLNVCRSVYAIPYFSSQFLQVDKGKNLDKEPEL